MAIKSSLISTLFVVVVADAFIFTFLLNCIALSGIVSLVGEATETYSSSFPIRGRISSQVSECAAGVYVINRGHKNRGEARAWCCTSCHNYRVWERTKYKGSSSFNRNKLSRIATFTWIDETPTQAYTGIVSRQAYIKHNELRSI